MKFDRNKTIKILGALFIVQILIFVGFTLFSSQKLKSQTMDKPLIKSLKKDNIISLVIKDAVNSFNLEKKDNKWMVKIDESLLPVDESKINSYLESLSKMNTGLIVFNGADASSDKSFGFDEKKNQTLTIKTTNASYLIHIGNPGSKRGSSYIKLNDEKKIREINTAIASETSNNPSDWSKKNIFDNLKETDVVSCEFSSKFSWFKGNYKISFKEPKDKTKSSFIIEPEIKDVLQNFVLDNTIRSLISLSISEYKLKGDVTGKEILGSIKLIKKDTKNYNLDFYKADATDPGAYILKTNLTDYLYLINEETAKQLFKDTKDMIVKPENK